VILVTWGVVPTQAGIFSTKLISQVGDIQFERSTSFILAAEQPSKLSVEYAQSAYSIATLNQTLNSYMARNYTLSPFKPAPDDENRIPKYGNWTAPTMLYSLDMLCEPAKLSSIVAIQRVDAISTNGCNFTGGLNGNLTIGKTFLLW
jgi:hypothetical protein